LYLMGGGASKRKRRKLDDDDSDDGTAEGDGRGGKYLSFWGQDYVDPPMPEIGKPIGYKEIESRTRAVKFAMKQMMKVTAKQAIASLEAGKNIPVSRQLERVQVTEEITALIMARKDKRDDLLWVRDNLTEIQGALAIRRAALKMLNHNYMDVVVRKIDPIQTDEARTVHKHKDTHDEETKSPSKSPSKSPNKVIPT